MGIEILPPDVNESYANFRVHGNSIRFGLAAVKNVGESAIEAIVYAREEKGNFQSLFDFCERVDLKSANRKCIESLIKCGAFDSCGGGHRAQLLESLDIAMEHGQKTQKDRLSGQVLLFDTLKGFKNSQSLRNAQKLSDAQILAMEKEMLGFYMSGHLLARFDGIISKFANTSTLKAGNAENGTQVTIVGIIMSVRRQITKNNKQMAFVTLEDLDGTIDLIIFTEALSACSEKLNEGRIVWVKGVISNRDNVCIRVDEMLLMDELRKKLITSVHVKLSIDPSKQPVLKSLKDICLSNRGDCPLFLHLRTPSFSDIVVQANPDTSVAPTDSFIAQVEQLAGEQSVWFDATH